MGTILAQVPSTFNYVLSIRASHPAMASEHVGDTPVCHECESLLPLDRDDFLCCKCRLEQMERNANRDLADRAVEQARRQQQATLFAQAILGAAVGTKVTLSRRYVNRSTGLKYEAGTAGVLGDGCRFVGGCDQRLVEFSKCPWYGSFLVPCGLLELAKDTELAEVTNPNMGAPFWSG